jgi:hypothetical protein
MSDDKFDYSEHNRKKWPKLSESDSLLESRLLEGLKKMPLHRKERSRAHMYIVFALDSATRE